MRRGWDKLSLLITWIILKSWRAISWLHSCMWEAGTREQQTLFSQWNGWMNIWTYLLMWCFWICVMYFIKKYIFSDVIADIFNHFTAPWDNCQTFTSYIPRDLILTRGPIKFQVLFFIVHEPTGEHRTHSCHDFHAIPVIVGVCNKPRNVSRGSRSLHCFFTGKLYRAPLIKDILQSHDGTSPSFSFKQEKIPKDLN